ncbi:MAG: histidine kinase [Verrucomicrobiota bacterium]
MRVALILVSALGGMISLGHAGLSPFPDIDTPTPGSRELPDVLQTDLVDAVVQTQESSADRIARLFNRDLRELEEAQQDIVDQLGELPRQLSDTRRVSGFGYLSGRSPQRPKWVQIDLGREVTPDAIALFPVTALVDGEVVYGYGFPRGFRVDISNEAEFRNYETMVEARVDDPKSIRRWPYFREVSGYSGRYLRITATSLWRSPGASRQVLAMSEVMVLEGERNIAAGRPVRSLDSEERANQWSRRFLTDGLTELGLPQSTEESPTFGYRVDTSEPKKASWVQLDLGESLPIDEVQIVIAELPDAVPDPTARFPYSMQVSVSEHPDMRNAEVIARMSPSRLALVGTNPIVLPTEDARGRYLRITANSGDPPRRITFALAEIQVFSGTRNVARDTTVSAPDGKAGTGWAPEFLVDGFSSGRRLITPTEWLRDIDKRNRLVRRWFDKESLRRELVDRTVTLSASYLAGTLAAVFCLVLIILSRGRVRRRKDLEDLRQRIASDLHDDIGSNLSSIALLAELGKTETDEPEMVVEELTEIKATADKTIESMRDIVWLIRPGEETWPQMLARFRETAAKLLRAHEYTFTVVGEGHGDRLPLEFKRDIFLIYKEVLNNIVRHAQAENVKIHIEASRSRIQLRVEDDGIGFNNLDQEFREGNGLRNLRMRAQAIGGSIKVRSALTEGTSIQLMIPLP